MNINDLLSLNSGITVSVSIADLKEFAQCLINELRELQASAAKEDARLTAQEAAEQLGKSINTLWRWEKQGYLIPAGRCGRNPYYLQSQIDKFLNMGGC